MMDFNVINEVLYYGIWIELFVKIKFDSEFKKNFYFCICILLLICFCVVML